MPINLDGCITGIFVPGNIGASSGLPPVVRVMPPRAPGTFNVQVHEVTSATDRPDQNPFTGAILEIAAAVDVVNPQAVLVAAVAEVAAAADVVNTTDPILASVVESATATATQDATQVFLVRSAMLAGPQPVFVNTGAPREGNVAGVMVNT